jgi:hypothetical protein
VSVKAPIPSKNFSRNVKIISALATVTVISAIFYYCLNSDKRNYIQHVKECMKGFNIPGCKNGVYCPNKDPTFVIKPLSGITQICVNDIDSAIFEGSKKLMLTDLNKYLESRNIFENIYDAVYDKIFL